ncbi:MAG: SDR family oxidoreductase [Pirellulaceae bacterium]
MSSTVVVTGGAGFIGSHIVDRLLREGNRVCVVDNLCTGHLQNLQEVYSRIEFFEGDIRDAEILKRAFANADFVIHQAALASVPLSLENPVEVNDVCVNGTLNVLECARKAGVQRVVYAGSSSCYGDSPFTAKRETDELMTLSPYAVAKLAGEKYCQSFYHSFGLETVVLRYFNVFGPRQDPTSHYSAVIPLFITWLLQGQRPIVYGDGRQSRDFCFVSDIAAANYLAMTTPEIAGETFNISCGQTTSLVDLLKILEELLDVKADIDFQPARKGDVRHSMADISRATAGLNFIPKVTFREGLEQSIEYYRSVVKCLAV